MVTVHLWWVLTTKGRDNRVLLSSCNPSPNISHNPCTRTDVHTPNHSESTLDNPPLNRTIDHLRATTRRTLRSTQTLTDQGPWQRLRGLLSIAHLQAITISLQTITIKLLPTPFVSKRINLWRPGRPLKGGSFLSGMTSERCR